MGSLPVAPQLYTVRDHLDKDPAGTLKRVKEIGYDYVELAGMAGMTAAECKQALDDIGLTPVSSHFGREALEDDLGGTIETCKTLGIDFAVLPHASADDKDGWIAIAKMLDGAGAKLREAGIRLCYHNHAHEFKQFDGQYAFDLLYEIARPENLALQLDTFWVQYGKADPVEKIKQYAGRCPLLHMKDMAPEGEQPIFAEMGKGIMDWPPILDAAKAAGVEWYIVEQDDWAGDSIESAAISAEFMAQL